MKQAGRSVAWAVSAHPRRIVRYGRRYSSSMLLTLLKPAGPAETLISVKDEVTFAR